jgi:hypothetical protein
VGGGVTGGVTGGDVTGGDVTGGDVTGGDVTGGVELTGGVATNGVLGVLEAGGETAVVLGVVTGDVVELAPGEAADVAPAAPLESPPPPQAASAIAANIEAETFAYIMVGTGLQKTIFGKSTHRLQGWRRFKSAGGIPIPGETQLRARGWRRQIVGEARQGL